MRNILIYLTSFLHTILFPLSRVQEFINVRHIISHYYSFSIDKKYPIVSLTNQLSLAFLHIYMIKLPILCEFLGFFHSWGKWITGTPLTPLKMNVWYSVMSSRTTSLWVLCVKYVFIVWWMERGSARKCSQLLSKNDRVKIVYKCCLSRILSYSESEFERT